MVRIAPNSLMGSRLPSKTRITGSIIRYGPARAIEAGSNCITWMLGRLDELDGVLVVRNG